MGSACCKGRNAYSSQQLPGSRRGLAGIGGRRCNSDNINLPPGPQSQYDVAWPSYLPPEANHSNGSPSSTATTMGIRDGGVSREAAYRGGGMSSSMDGKDISLTGGDNGGGSGLSNVFGLWKGSAQTFGGEGNSKSKAFSEEKEQRSAGEELKKSGTSSTVAENSNDRDSFEKK